MSRGCLERPPCVLKPCETKCPFCRGEWQKIFLPVNKVKVIRFLECDTFQKQMGTLVASGDNIVNSLWEKEEKWRLPDIFGKKTVKRGNVDAFFCQLIATKIIELRPTSNGLVWHYGRSRDLSTAESRETILNYKQDASWVGIRTI